MQLFRSVRSSYASSLPLAQRCFYLQFVLDNFAHGRNLGQLYILHALIAPAFRDEVLVLPQELICVFLKANMLDLMGTTKNERYKTLRSAWQKVASMPT